MIESSRCYYVYVLFRPWDGTPFYVGKGKKRRWLDHEKLRASRPNKHLANIVKKARHLKMEIPRVKIREGLTEEEAFIIERAFIAAIGRHPNGPLVNATDGGEGSSGWKPSALTRAKRSLSMRGNQNALGIKRSPETIAKLRSKTFSIDTRAKISAAHKGKKLTAEHREKLKMAKLGRTLSIDHVAKIAAANRGKKRSDQARENLRAGQLKRYQGHSPHGG